jgi:hypothetical protein
MLSLSSRKWCLHVHWCSMEACFDVSLFACYSCETLSLIKRNFVRSSRLFKRTFLDFLKSALWLDIATKRSSSSFLLHKRISNNSGGSRYCRDGEEPRTIPFLHMFYLSSNLASESMLVASVFHVSDFHRMFIGWCSRTRTQANVWRAHVQLPRYLSWSIANNHFLL